MDGLSRKMSCCAANWNVCSSMRMKRSCSCDCCCCALCHGSWTRTCADWMNCCRDPCPYRVAPYPSRTSCGGPTTTCACCCCSHPYPCGWTMSRCDASCCCHRAPCPCPDALTTNCCSCVDPCRDCCSCAPSTSWRNWSSCAPSPYHDACPCWRIYACCCCCCCCGDDGGVRVHWWSPRWIEPPRSCHHFVCGCYFRQPHPHSFCGTRLAVFLLFYSFLSFLFTLLHCSTKLFVRIFNN